MRDNRPSILFHTNQTYALKLLTQFAKKYNYRLRRAADIADVIAYTNTASIIQKDFIEEWFLGHLKEVFVHAIPTEIHSIIDNEVFIFEDMYIVFGDGPDIPSELSHFFIEVKALTEELLERQLLKIN